MTKVQSQVLAGVAVYGLYAVGILFDALANGAFSLPRTWATALLSLAVPVHQLVAFLIHGLSSGSWDVPLPLPQSRPPAGGGHS